MGGTTQGSGRVRGVGRLHSPLLYIENVYPGAGIISNGRVEFVVLGDSTRLFFTLPKAGILSKGRVEFVVLGDSTRLFFTSRMNTRVYPERGYLAMVGSSSWCWATPLASSLRRECLPGGGILSKGRVEFVVLGDSTRLFFTSRMNTRVYPRRGYLARVGSIRGVGRLHWPLLYVEYVYPGAGILSKGRVEFVVLGDSTRIFFTSRMNTRVYPRRGYLARGGRVRGVGRLHSPLLYIENVYPGRGKGRVEFVVLGDSTRLFFTSRMNTRVYPERGYLAMVGSSSWCWATPLASSLLRGVGRLHSPLLYIENVYPGAGQGSGRVRSVGRLHSPLLYIENEHTSLPRAGILSKSRVEFVVLGDSTRLFFTSRIVGRLHSPLLYIENEHTSLPRAGILSKGRVEFVVLGDSTRLFFTSRMNARVYPGRRWSAIKLSD
ncbi:hypothetical protein PR048_003827 [Dryococelus australis]|uniref:Uncharacterized protein n=1 Tax=Dryococelus australis TaxID=614101 RepID=A0ABQ9IP68_9NEOP|nr:hypothetical protein PR048_003827 [Dryococelus australis]